MRHRLPVDVDGAERLGHLYPVGVVRRGVGLRDEEGGHPADGHEGHHEGQDDAEGLRLRRGRVGCCRPPWLCRRIWLCHDPHFPQTHVRRAPSGPPRACRTRPTRHPGLIPVLVPPDILSKLTAGIHLSLRYTTGEPRCRSPGRRPSARRRRLGRGRPRAVGRVTPWPHATRTTWPPDAADATGGGRLHGGPAVRLHLTLAAGLALCIGAFVFEVGRALGGNSLSWAYVFEWPIFAVFAVYMWWNLLHDTDGDAVGAGRRPRPMAPARPAAATSGTGAAAAGDRPDDAGDTPTAAPPTLIWPRGRRTCAPWRPTSGVRPGRTAWADGRTSPPGRPPWPGARYGRR